MTDRKTVWVTGHLGFVGSVMTHGLSKAGYNVVGTDVELLVTEPERLESFAEEVRPSIIVNCAGIKRDAATLGNKVHAYEVNALGARNLAIAANAIGALIVQISSDDVYGTKVEEPVNEFDLPHANTPYGKSKLAGESMVRTTTPEHLILRTSWLYDSGFGRFKKLLDAAKEGHTYESRIDQFSAPTSAEMYMHYVLKMLESGARGTYHISPTGKTSRFNFATKILELAGYDPDKVLVPAQDPATEEDVVLESLMLEMAGATLPTWEGCLESYMEHKGLIPA